MQPKMSLSESQGPSPSPQPIDEMLERMYEHIGRLKARAARAPPTPSGSSVTEPDSDPDKDESGIVSFYVAGIQITRTHDEQSPPWPDIPKPDAIMNIHFQNLIAFCDTYPPIQRAYRDFLHARPTMDPESFKRVSSRLCQTSETIIFLTKCLSYHMALMMGKKTKNNRIFVEYLEGASGNLRKAKEFIDLAAEELCAYQEAEEGQRSSGKLYTVVQFTQLMQCTD